MQVGVNYTVRDNCSYPITFKSSCQNICRNNQEYYQNISKNSHSLVDCSNLFFQKSPKFKIKFCGEFKQSEILNHLERNTNSPDFKLTLLMPKGQGNRFINAVICTSHQNIAFKGHNKEIPETKENQENKKHETILVTGGTGYIGSHCVLDLLKHGYDCIVFDNLNDNKQLVVKELEELKFPDKGNIKFVKGNLVDINKLKQVFDENKIDAVIHLAASGKPRESVENPRKYYLNNVVGTLNLLNEMVDHKVSNLVYSSTAAVYGNTQDKPIKEESDKNPASPYGRTKLMVEDILKDYDKAYGLNSITFRYFNVLGTDKNMIFGISPSVILYVLKAGLEGKTFKINGADYNTTDGTCVRDYVHVEDIALANRLAVEKLLKRASSGIYNLGSGKGYSIKEIVDHCSKILNTKIKTEDAPRQPGDPEEIVASCDKAKRDFGWEPSKTLDDMIKTTLNFLKNDNK